MSRAPLPQPLLGSHEPLPFTHVEYELTGNAHDGVIAVLGGISAGRSVEDWWPEQVGPGRALNREHAAILGIDFLGADLRAGARVPRLDTCDQARALAAVLDHLDIQRLRAIVGASYGGMVGLAFAALFPQRVESLLVIGAAHEPHPMASAVRSVQRQIVALGISSGRTPDALGLARQLAMTTYRTAEEFSERFRQLREVEDYLAHCGRRYSEQFTAERFLCLSESIDLHSVAPESVTVPTTLVAIEGDSIAPPWQLRALAERIAAPTTLIEIKSIFGHDAFLKESAAIAAILTRTLQVEACI